MDEQRQTILSTSCLQGGLPSHAKEDEDCLGQHPSTKVLWPPTEVEREEKQSPSSGEQVVVLVVGREVFSGDQVVGIGITAE